jgi:hypothetical protein
MSNLNQFLVDQQKNKPKHTAKIRGSKPRGTTDEDEGRRGLHRHQEEVEDGDREYLEDEGLRDAV